MPAELKTAEPEFWQSIDQWMDSAKFETMMKDEFPEDASEWLDPVSRRQFLSLAGASVALAGAVGCNPSFKPAPQKKIVPYVKQPDQIIPGVPLFFATAMPQQGGVGLGLLVKSHEGRPIKCEGNPNHPSSLGSIEHQALAAPLTMYDPDRSQQAKQGAVGSTFEKALIAIKDELSKRANGAGVRFVTEPSTSPTFNNLMMEEVAKRFPAAKWIQYEPVSKDNATKGAIAAFSKPVEVVYDIAKADVILSLDADFLSGPGSVRYARDFGARRKVSTVDATHELEHHSGTGKHEHASDDKVANKSTEDMNRLYVVEGALTSTGAIADHRLPLKPSQIEAFARSLAAELKVAGVTAAADLPELAKKWIPELAKDLLAKKRHAVVIPGDQQSPAVHLLAHAINNVLEAKAGEVVKFIAPLQAKPADRFAELKTLADEMKAGQVEVLIMSGVNPVYDAPADLEFGKAIDTVKSKKGVVVHHGLYQDETGHEKYINFHLPAAHFLESWGDVRGHDGTVSIQQPLIAPLYNGKSTLELVAQLLDLPATDGLSLVQNTTRAFFDKKIQSGKFEDYWQKSLRDGVLSGSASEAVDVTATVSLDKLNDKDFTQAAIKGLEIQFRPDPVLFDGKQANNGWLQELPKPITNLTWDNAALVSPRTAEELKIEQGFKLTGGERGSTETDVAELTVNGRKLSAAVHIVPGMADGVVVLHLGFGRERGGRVAGLYQESPNYTPGFNAYKLRGTDAVWTASVDLVRIAGKEHILAIAGAHAAMESRRPVRHATKAEFAADIVFAQVPASSAGEYEEIRSLTPGTPENFEILGLKHKHAHHHEGEGHDHKGHDARVKKLSLYLANPITVNGQEATKSYRRWGMTIDLGSCIGCSACTLACVAENNTPVVGKDQVRRGRAMHWIRVDRYYSIPGKKAMEDELGGYDVKPAQRKEKAKESAAIRAHFQPVPCQHCEKAPCEVVCPVGATVHSADGLNDMAYNRCVGTRYCANNCPYKVRRFNFLQYTDYTTDSLKLLNNPEVSVRQRGVMEKCTYCTQRIRNAEIEAEREWDKKLPNGKPARPLDANGRPKILDGEVITACQQACPTGAITFGDLNDPDSKVLKTKAEVHNYGLLAEYNTMPRTSYLAAIRNPNPNMPQGA